MGTIFRHNTPAVFYPHRGEWYSRIFLIPFVFEGLEHNEFNFRILVPAVAEPSNTCDEG